MGTAPVWKKRESHFANCYVAPWIVRPVLPAWREVFALGKRRTYKKRAIVVHMDENCDEVLFILAGFMRILAFGLQGSQRNIAILGPGSLLGEANLFCGLGNSHCIQVVEKCTAIAFSTATLRNEILPKYPELAASICENLAMKSYIMSTQLECQSFMNSSQRIAHFLYYLALEQRRLSAAWHWLRRLSLTSVAELLGMHRVTVTNAINNFRRQGILDAHSEYLVIQDYDALMFALCEA